MSGPTTFSVRALGVALLAACGLAATTAPAVAAPAKSQAERHAAIVSHWSAERRAAAIPRDLRIDGRGLGYLRYPDGTLAPYGHSIAATSDARTPAAQPSAYNTAAEFSGMSPAAGATLTGSSQQFKATINEPDGIRSVNVVIVLPSGLTQSFKASSLGNNVWGVTINGFSDNCGWGWRMVVKDRLGGAGSTTTSDTLAFDVNLDGIDQCGGGSGGGGGGTGGGGGDSSVSNANWISAFGNTGAVVKAAGRIYFEMPSNKRRTRWGGYVCSGTVATDATSNRSIIQTASHCVYDDANKAFARNVLFIPDQAESTSGKTDLNCSNDPIGCWTPAFGVVDTNWTTRTFPDNVAWDYGYYVVSDTDAHTSSADRSVYNSVALDDAANGAGSLPLSFAPPQTGATNADAYTYALGYSYDQDPNFMYCAQNMENHDSANWKLGNCGLSGGSSGGPWVQPMATDSAGKPTGTGPIISVNSWGYTNSPGMWGPKLSGSSAECVFGAAKSKPFDTVPSTDGDAGAVVSCP